MTCQKEFSSHYIIKVMDVDFGYIKYLLICLDKFFYFSLFFDEFILVYFIQK